ncbi:MAG: hypothetical protein AAGA58_19275 [Verrucomicrobiota bacterium]
MKTPGLPLLITLLAFSIGGLSCDRHSWDDTKTLFHKHGGDHHGDDHGDHSKDAHGDDHAKEGGHDKDDHSGEEKEHGKTEEKKKDH